MDQKKDWKVVSVKQALNMWVVSSFLVLNLTNCHNLSNYKFLYYTYVTVAILIKANTYKCSNQGFPLWSLFCYRSHWQTYAEF